MKRLLFIPLLFFSLILSAATYYVAPSTATPAGNDSNPGTISQPWLTWNKAISMAYPGDTIYFRGGIYYTTSSNGISINADASIGRNGTKADPICYFGYPSDYAAGNIPIFDGTNHTPPSVYNYGMRVRFTSYIKFKGFEIRNIEQVNPNGQTYGIYLAGGTNVTFENVTVRNIGGAGFGVSADSASFTNCDAWYCADPYTDDPYRYGAGDGWQVASHGVRFITWFKGCRAIHCSDDGWDNYWNDGVVMYDSCWALSTGYDSNHEYYGPGSAGNGFKLGKNMLLSATGEVQRSLTNCLAVSNHGIGFTENNSQKPCMRMNFFNNISYNSGYAGYYNFLNADAAPYYQRIYRNNTSYLDDTTRIFNEQNELVEDHNTWNAESGVTLTADDFVSLDTAQLYAARQADGSLPSINFMHIAEGSDLIDAGIDVGLPYNGLKPDISWVEYGTVLSSKTVKYRGKIVNGIGRIIRKR